MFLSGSRFWKNLKKHVKCSICLHTYTKPKIITCLHSFYCEYLERHALTREKQGLYPCAERQAQICISKENRFDNVLSSFFQNKFLSFLAARSSGRGNEISCSTCQKKSAKINYCFECEKYKRYLRLNSYTLLRMQKCLMQNIGF